MASFKSFKKKKPPVLSREEREGIKKRLAEYAARKKTLKAYALLRKKKSEQDVKLSGVFKDRAELDKCVEDYIAAMNKSAGEPLWEVLSVYEIMPDKTEIDEESKDNLAPTDGARELLAEGTRPTEWKNTERSCPLID